MSIVLTSSGLRSFISSHGSKLVASFDSQTVLTQAWTLPRHTRALETQASPRDEVPFRKLLKDEAKRKRATINSGNRDTQRSASSIRPEKWELTVGIEIHAQLNTARKLFSRAPTSAPEQPNSHVTDFDIALPGSQPLFQKATLIPALRAAIALGCDIQRQSAFDRKHYFYADQPAGYQITQYYEPFAKDGSITIYDHDGISPKDGQSITVGIKQIQMEQDTAKTIQQPPSTTLLDFNRVGHPLIEIITLPKIHYPQTAAACVKKIQAILQAVNAVTTGMELGGLRADVNVSVRRRIPLGDELTGHGYHGITGLGQRTEIKNLNSFKSVEDAIIAERDRQISVLESGGTIEGETRGWNLGSTETRKLRGKEGEVDYRYMPDPDLFPVFIGDDLVEHISRTLPKLPDDSVCELVEKCGLTHKDAKTLIELDDGARLDYYDKVLECLGRSLSSNDKALAAQSVQQRRSAKTAANWVLHELGGRLSASDTAFSDNRVAPAAMASIIENLMADRITGRTAKQLLTMVFNGELRDIDTIIEAENMELVRLAREVYLALAQDLILEHSEMVRQIKQKGQVGKVKWFVGQMMRQGEGKVEAARAEAILRELLGLKK